MAQALLGAHNPADIAESATTLYAEGQAFAASDWMDVQGLVNGWTGTYRPHNERRAGLVYGHMEAGVQWRAWRLGLLHRGEAFASASPDTTDLFDQYTRSSGYTPGRSYALDYRLTGFTARGIRLSHSLVLGQTGAWIWRAGWAVSGLQGIQAKMETAAGQAVAVSAQDFNANLVQTTHDSTTDTSGKGSFNPPFGAHPSVSGQGYSTDLALTAQDDEGSRYEFAVFDAVGALEWRNLPKYRANYNSATKTYDADGYVHFNPTATALSSYENLVLPLEPKWRIAASKQWGAVQLGARLEHAFGVPLPQWELGYLGAEGWRVSVGWESRFNSWGLAWEWHGLRAGLRTDALPLERASALGAYWAVHIALR
ncbi:MAG: hypothetical protein ACT4NV_19975 [Rhodoferax sp.]